MQATLEPTPLDEKTQTTSHVGVRLSGAGFKIDPAGTVWQTIPDGGSYTFEWLVTPTNEKASQLMVSVLNKVVLGDAEIVIEAQNFPQAITVTVDVWTRIGRFFTGVDAAIGTAKNIGIGVAALFGFGGIGALYAAIRTFRKRRNSFFSS